MPQLAEFSLAEVANNLPHISTDPECGDLYAAASAEPTGRNLATLSQELVVRGITTINYDELCAGYLLWAAAAYVDGNGLLLPSTVQKIATIVDAQERHGWDDGVAEFTTVMDSLVQDLPQWCVDEYRDWSVWVGQCVAQNRPLPVFGLRIFRDAVLGSSVGTAEDCERILDLLPVATGEESRVLYVECLLNLARKYSGEGHSSEATTNYIQAASTGLFHSTIKEPEKVFSPPVYDLLLRIVLDNPDEFAIPSERGFFLRAKKHFIEENNAAYAAAASYHLAKGRYHDGDNKRAFTEVLEVIKHSQAARRLDIYLHASVLLSRLWERAGDMRNSTQAVLSANELVSRDHDFDRRELVAQHALYQRLAELFQQAPGGAEGAHVWQNRADQIMQALNG
ncbi:Uncharacterised protein [Corynebacterium renale]|uniref:hypothetical protein n=1 Tax=Corynebacterium renale TaxID=1724 RepID=UPI000DA35896|nr:hypothetical protein [Corynebacterium renale]SQG63575.1 Uncharacterised protein [Corynebacterium renale]STD01000.1 Uncharacterised protein [Corynebacterium renale]